MTAEEQQHFRVLLEGLARELRAGMAHEDPARDSIAPDSAIGRLTRMEALQAQEMTAEGRRRMAARLKQVERAIERLDSGAYGTCVRCGEDIPRGRLEIMPETLHCLRCAARAR